MKCMRVVFLIVALALGASAADIAGKWEVVFLGPEGHRPKTVSRIILDLKADGTELTGMVHAGNWPGDAPISDGKIEGDRISFTAVGHSPWWSSRAGARASGYPRLKFTGTIRGGELQLTLVWDSVMLYGETSGSASEWEMKGRKAVD
jgi:hypothetical protein